MNKSETPLKVSVQDMYEDSEVKYDAFIDFLDQSLNPRSPDVLFQTFGQLALPSNALVLDLGCRVGAQACELANRFAQRVIGLDLITTHVEDAQKRVQKEGLQSKVQIVQGNIQQVPFKNQLFDAIWCRDVLSHMSDLDSTFAHCARVLKSNGKMVVFQMFGTALMSDEELEAMCLPLASVAHSMRRKNFEQAFTSAGFSIQSADELHSEWREYGEESGNKTTSKQLLRIARLRRNKAKIIEQFGEVYYASELANCHWGIYQMLGKLSPIMYTLNKN